MTQESLAGFFLGAHGEQRALFEELLAAYVSDHFAWRRKFHPEDRSAVDPTAPEYTAFIDRTRAEMLRLAGALQRSVPVASPRYLGHMTSDLLLPAVLAQLVTTLYNPNNVTSEVAPVTVSMERAAAMQLAAMVGYATDAAGPVRAWGHLTGGGTVANIESLWVARAVRCWPIAVLRAARQSDCAALRELVPDDESQAFNLPVDAVHALHARVNHWLAALAPDARERAAAAIESERIEQRGAAAYPPMHVFVPATAHYSWSKAVRLLGIGSDQLHAVPVTARMRMDERALADALDECRAAGQAVLAVVPVLGTTEYGTIDPVHEVVALRDRCAAAGQSFWIHVDAAWGGYLASMFRAPDGRMLPLERVRDGFRWFPSRAVYDAFAALPRCDSLTVDPHKLGYIPYGAGAFLLRDGRNRHFVSQHAPYVFDGERNGDDEPGRYALEGSRPGAMAAAVCVAHRVLPLHAEAFGRLPADSVRANECLFGRLEALSLRLGGTAALVVPYEPDTNLICIAVNPAGTRNLRGTNAFMRKLYEQMAQVPGRARPREFYASRTQLPLAKLGSAATETLCARLGVDTVDDDHVFLLRHTLMNPGLLENDGEFLTRYCEFLEREIRSNL